MSFDPAPTPEPRGDLAPPVRRPPTAVATATPPPPRPPRPPVRAPRTPWLLRAAGRALTAALDAADRVGDTIREALGAPPPRPPGGEVAVRRGPDDSA
jgi:hypothetical protein